MIGKMQQIYMLGGRALDAYRAIPPLPPAAKKTILVGGVSLASLAIIAGLKRQWSKRADQIKAPSTPASPTPTHVSGNPDGGSAETADADTPPADDDSDHGGTYDKAELEAGHPPPQDPPPATPAQPGSGVSDRPPPVSESDSEATHGTAYASCQEHWSDSDA